MSFIDILLALQLNTLKAGYQVGPSYAQGSRDGLIRWDSFASVFLHACWRVSAGASLQTRYGSRVGHRELAFTVGDVMRGYAASHLTALAMTLGTLADAGPRGLRGT